ncbi:MAG: hypothetical protein NT033_02540, partial [Candidatus Omnitrophica bacterium]|nr:hypothetical protein [Candidatus Omnitrophota bacterium]
MRRQRQNSPAALQAKKRRVSFSYLIFFITSSLVLIFAFGFIRLVAVNSGFFKIKDIVVRRNFKYPAPASLDVAYLKGKNIFAVDLEKESSYLGQVYPNYKRVRLFRIFPDRLFADFVIRRPIAYVKLYRLFYVSDDLILFSAPLDVQDLRLPVITGLETRIFGPKSGVRYTNKELVLALRVIGEVRLNRALRNYAIKKINAQSLDNFSFYLLDESRLESGNNPEG